MIILITVLIIALGIYLIYHNYYSFPSYVSPCDFLDNEKAEEMLCEQSCVQQCIVHNICEGIEWRRIKNIINCEGVEKNCETIMKEGRCDCNHICLNVNDVKTNKRGIVELVEE